MPPRFGFKSRFRFRFGAWRRAIPLVGGVFLTAALLMGLVGAGWAAAMRAPRVVLLGSGARMSTLITAGDARLLIATGDDASAFQNALAAARHPTTPRIDVLLVTGRGDDLVVPAAIRHDRDVRFAASLGPLSNAAGAIATAGDGLPVLPSPREIRLGAGVTVTIATVPGDEEQQGATHWRALVRHGATTVAIVSDGEAAAALPPAEPIAALVVVGGDPIDAWRAIPAPVLATVGADRVASGKELRQEGAEVMRGRGPGWAIRVHPGEAVPLRFVTGGLEVPRDAAQPIPASPVAVERGRFPARRAALRRGGRRVAARTPPEPFRRVPARPTDRPRPAPAPWRRPGCSRSPTANRRRRPHRGNARCRHGPGSGNRFRPTARRS